MKIQDLFDRGLTTESTISEMIELLASITPLQETELEQCDESVDYTIPKRSQNPLIEAALGYMDTKTSLTEAKDPKMGTNHPFHDTLIKHGYSVKGGESRHTTYEKPGHHSVGVMSNKHPAIPDTGGPTHVARIESDYHKGSSKMIDSDHVKDLDKHLSDTNATKKDEKKGTAWTRKVVGKGSTENTGRGSHQGSHELTHAETQARVHKAVAAGKNSGDVVSHRETTANDGTVHHTIKLGKQYGHYRSVHISSHPDHRGGDANTNFDY